MLAAIGLYGVTSYSVARRTSEIGLRMALGADRGQVMRLVLGGAFRRVAVGLILGLPLAVGTGYLLSAQLYNVPYWDPVGTRCGRRVARPGGAHRLARARGPCRGVGADAGAADELTHIGGPAGTRRRATIQPRSGDKLR